MPVIIRDGATGPMRLQLAGRIDLACVADVDHALDLARRTHRPVILDLGKVRLIDRPTLLYVIDVIHGGVESVINCPDYVRAWIDRELRRTTG